MVLYRKCGAGSTLPGFPRFFQFQPLARQAEVSVHLTQSPAISGNLADCGEDDKDCRQEDPRLRHATLACIREETTM